MVYGMTVLQQGHPGIMELNLLLQARQGNYWKEKTISDRQFAIFIASHYRATIANDRSWNDPIALSMIKGEQRQFAERCVAEHPAPTKEEIADADAALEPQLRHFAEALRPHPLGVALALLIVYVGIPALIAALLFRGGLVLRMAGITFVRRDGKQASRLRVFWRALVAWSSLGLALLGLMPILLGASSDLALGLACGLFCGLAVLSVALPERGLPDRLAGTWPVPR